MKTLAEIKEDIEKLSRKEFWKLAKWFDKRKDDVWDKEIEVDARPGGPLDKLASKAMKEHEAGLTVPLEDVLRGPKKPFPHRRSSQASTRPRR